MKMILFALYYCKLQMEVLVGLRPTSLPMDLNWRWEFWQKRRRAQRMRMA